MFMRVSETLERLETTTYPASPEQLVVELGDPEIHLPAGNEQLADAFDRIDVDQFSTPEDAKLALLSGLSEDAIGRKGYSDRDPPTESDPGPDVLTL